MFKKLPLVPSTDDDPAKWLTPKNSSFLSWAVDFPNFVEKVFNQSPTCVSKHPSFLFDS